MEMEQLSGILRKRYYPPFLLDSELILGIFSEDRKVGVKKFIEYNEMENQDSILMK